MRLLARKLTIAAGATAVSGLVAFAAYRWAAPADVGPLRIVDNTAEVSALLEARASEVPATRPAAAVAGPTPGLVREPIDEETARETLFRLLQYSQKYVHDPVSHLWQRPSLELHQPFPEHPDGGWTIRTNAAGFRKERELSAAPPDLRIVVAGDSHTAGMVPGEECFPNVLEELLLAADPARTVEGLNAGIGGTAPYSYLGMLEKHLALRPDVFVVTLYGGNDFQGVLSLHRYFNRLPAPTFGPHGGQRLVKALPRTGLSGQQLGQVAYFLDNPGDVEVSLAAVRAITDEMQRRCDEAGVRLICLYLPAAWDVEPAYLEDDMAAALEKVAFGREDLAVSARLGDAWVAWLAERGIEHLDLRPVLRAVGEPCYWSSDLHLNTRGHRAVAEALVPLIERTVD